MTYDHGTYSMLRGTVDLTELGRRLEARFPTLTSEERRIALAVFEEMAGGQPAAPSAIGARAHVAAPTVARALDGWPGVEPECAVLSFVDPSHCDVSGDRVISSFCHHILFFRSQDDWREWTMGRTPRTFILTIEEGWRLGRITNRLRYGDALVADRTARPVEEVR